MPDLVAQHLEELRANGYAEGTIILAAGWLQNLQKFAGERCLTELGPKDLEQWHKELTWTPGPKGRMYSPNTVNQAVGAARRLYRFLLADGRVTQDPTAGLRTRACKDKSWKLSFTVAQVRQLLAAPDLDTSIGIRDRAILGLLLETQISRAACARMDLAHLCFDTGALMSTGRSRRLYSLSDGLLSDLDRYRLESRPLLVSLEPRSQTQAFFLTREGSRINVPTLYQVVQRYRKRCGF